MAERKPTFDQMVDAITHLAKAEDRKRAIELVANSIRADPSYATSFEKGNRLAYLRRLLHRGNLPPDEVGIARDPKITTERNEECAARAAEVAAAPSKPPIPGYERRTVERYLMRLAKSANPDRDFPRARERQQFIRYVVMAGALRPSEFSTIDIAKVSPKKWIATHIAKAPANEARPFIALIGAEYYAKCLAICRRWVGEGAPLDDPDGDGYEVLDPYVPKEQARFKIETEYEVRPDAPPVIYTYKDLRALGASEIGYARTAGDQTGAKRALTVRTALRHKDAGLPPYERYDHFRDTGRETIGATEAPRASAAVAVPGEDGIAHGEYEHLAPIALPGADDGSEIV